MSEARAETCSGVAERLGEPLLATAPETRGWLVVEHPGPWGRDALGESGLEPETVDTISARAGALGVRVLLARRPGRRVKGVHRRALLLAPGSSLVRELTYREESELRALDLAAGDAGAPVAGRVYLVCTHGRRDPCCARLGVAVARRLALHAADRVWECSHLGGHRFAGNVLVLPDALLLGRVTEANVTELVARLEQGLLPLAHVRGRCTDPAPVQAVEALARQELDVVDADAVLVRAVRELAGTTGERRIEAELTVGGMPVRLVATARPGEPRAVSCADGKLEAPTDWALELLEQPAG